MYLLPPDSPAAPTGRRIDMTTTTTTAVIADRAEYRELVARLENGELIAESTYDAMVDFAKAKKMKRPARPAEFFVAKAKAKAPKADRPLTRKECNDRLSNLDIPTSYLMPTLRTIVEYVETGYPEALRESIPAAVLAKLEAGA